MSDLDAEVFNLTLLKTKQTTKKLNAHSIAVIFALKKKKDIV